MRNVDVCRLDLEDHRAMMKTGLALVLVGHVNFVLGALVLGAVLRHISLHEQARSMGYAVANVLALAAGLLAVVAGILAIVLSKKNKSRVLVCVLLAVGLLAVLLSGSAMVGLIVALVSTVLNKGQVLLTHCNLVDSVSYYSITNECPFDPTRLYATTLTLWVLLIAMCVLEVVFLGRSCTACASFLWQPCPCGRSRSRRRKVDNKWVRGQLPEEMTSLSQMRPQEQDVEPEEQHELLARKTKSSVV
ncbi:keratinocyte-associated protein 3-like [Scleropages formosus]|uniref:Transmembrane protein 54b n=1 Tax=Scleropages formosus TaxID=113540 RepID=A0A8C9SGM3_SCLFO|nr:keratinocyte-associated protein 3-like [Scleropages formosus]